jgi:hypothetical protein
MSNQTSSFGLPSTDGPPTNFTENTLPAYLRAQVGRYVRVEFILGSQAYMDRNGILIEVGTNYIVLQELGSQLRTVCDLYSIKFVNVFDIAPTAIAAMNQNAAELAELASPGTRIPITPFQGA